MSNPTELPDLGLNELEALAPCPHCGKSDPVRVVRASEDDDWRGDNEETHAVICDASLFEGVGPGGCGASGGYFRDKAEAVSAWNRRAQPEGEALQAENWQKLTEDSAINFGRLVDVVLTNGVYEYCRRCNQVDWTQVQDWRYAVPVAPAATLSPLCGAQHAEKVSCPECSGTGGVMMEGDCSDCNGKGYGWEPIAAQLDGGQEGNESNG